jgi:hypothetical protein
MAVIKFLIYIYFAHEYCHPNYGYHSCVSSCIIQDHGAYKHQNVRFISVHIPLKKHLSKAIATTFI